MPPYIHMPCIYLYTPPYICRPLYVCMPPYVHIIPFICMAPYIFILPYVCTPPYVHKSSHTSIHHCWSYAVSYIIFSNSTQCSYIHIYPNMYNVLQQNLEDIPKIWEGIFVVICNFSLLPIQTLCFCLTNCIWVSFHHATLSYSCLSLSSRAINRIVWSVHTTHCNIILRIHRNYLLVPLNDRAGSWKMYLTTDESFCGYYKPLARCCGSIDKE